ncbi:MAG: hypothetical protein MR210_09625 [Erysipelotrichaceae bacterium]|nr:hypothetical protein [Erysipelotrichaceae bacterium]MDY5251537.1 hypothetical protein [Erysipelotrichaceae bacterium]
MKKNIFENYTSITTSIIAIILGCLFLLRHESVYYLIKIGFILFALSLSLNQLLNIITKKRYDIQNILLLGADIFFLSNAIYHFERIIQLINMIMGSWLIIKAIVNVIDAYRCKIDMTHGTLNYSLKAIFHTIIGLSLVLQPSNKTWLVSLLIGGYLVLFGIFDTINKLSAHLPTPAKKLYKKHTSVSLPIFIDALIPQSFYFSAKKFYASKNLQFSNQPALDKPADLEVLIYLKSDGPESFGHVDISFNGLIYSYGCHDAHHRHLGGTFGDGVLIIAHRDKFIKQAMDDNKMIISYAFTLTDAEKKIIQERIDELCLRSIPWSCDAKLALEQKQDVSTINDYPSRVYKATGAMMYKFTKGKFKTYFVLSTNCVLLSDYLVRTPDLNLINLSGIVTPGSYLKFLNEEYLLNSPLLWRRLVYKKNMD